jgi:hypothetical protein
MTGRGADTRHAPVRRRATTTTSSRRRAVFRLFRRQRGSKRSWLLPLLAWRLADLFAEQQRSMGEGSPQLQWLRAELAANPSACSLAYWHFPLFSSGKTATTRPRAPSGVRCTTSMPTWSFPRTTTCTNGSRRRIPTAGRPGAGHPPVHRRNGWYHDHRARTRTRQQ